MFKINPNPLFTADVKLTVPGKKEPAIIGVTFKYKTRDQIVAFAEKIKDRPTEDSLCEIIDDWTGIDDKCTKENIALLVKNYAPAASEILEAYHRELLESRVKN